MSKFIIQLLALFSVISLSAGETLNEFNVNETINQQPRDFPCPDAADIAPCVCDYYSDLSRLTLDCTDITSNEELANILAKDFPVNEFWEFTMRSSSSLTALDFTCGGVKFQRFYLYPGPFPSLVEVSDDFYEACSDADLEYVQFRDTQLTSLTFPPPPLGDKITNFLMAGSNLTSVSSISSDSLTTLDLTDSQISRIFPGTFDEIPYLRNIYLHHNNIRTLRSDSIPITKNGYRYHFAENDLETIEPGAFAVKGEPPLDSLLIYLYDNLLQTIDVSVFGLLMPYINGIYIENNPLDCGCDFAWIILNPEYLGKMTGFQPPTCADGTLLTDLDPAAYEQFC